MMQIQVDVECSHCGSINMHEYVEDSSQRVIRCKKCNHSKVIWTMKATQNNWGVFPDMSVYNADIFKKDVF